MASAEPADLLLGGGLYETARVEDGALRAGRAHLARLQRSAAALGLPAVDEAAFAAAVRDADGEGDVVRVTLHAAADGSARLAAQRRPVGPSEPVRLVSLPGWYARGYALREHKLTSHFHGLWSRRLARRDGAEEGLLCERGSGLVGETGNANVAALVGGVLVTPPADGLLPGVTRAALLAAAGLDVPVREAPLTLGDVRHAQGLLLLSSPRGAVPAAALDGESLAPCDPDLLAAVLAALDRHARETALPL